MATITETRDYLAPKEVAHTLGVDVSVVYRAVQSGELPRLPAAEVAQRPVGVTLQAPVGVPVGLPVANEQQGGHDGLR